MRYALLIALALAVVPVVGHALDVEEQIRKARHELHVEDNRSSALRRLDAILEVQPDHLEARWLRLWFGELAPVETMEVMRRVAYVRDFTDEVMAVVKLANDQGNPAYGHYINSRFARLHAAYEEAEREIDRAIELVPDEPLYVWTKAFTLISDGEWNGEDETTYAGIALLEKAWQLARANPPEYLSEADFHFWTAWSLAKVKGSCSAVAQDMVDHYLAAIRLSERADQQVAYAWNNVSCPYRSMGQCDKARDAARSALGIMEFGAAKTNLRYAEFCLQMQELGVLPREQPSAQ
jgi:hypothetical protein